MLSNKFSKFILVGGTATLTQFLVLFFLVEAGITTPVYASATGFAISSVLNYYMSYRFTFSATIPHRTALIRFYLMVGAGLIINTLSYKIFMITLSVHPLIVQIPTTLIVLVWNFSVSYLWTFKS
ncbi:MULTISPECIES: GtrA family protein [Marinobacter]|jgi:putative flippase GtrA